MTLYIIHGWTYTTKYWAKTITALENSGIKVRLLHVPGLTAKSNKIFTMDDYVKWADDNLPKGAIALGHSNGGRILLNLAARDPKKLKHLILLNSAGIYDVTIKVKILRIAAKVFFIFGKIPLFRKILYKLLGVSDYNTAPPNMKKTLDNMIQSDKSLKLAQVQTPTSILWGSADTTTPPWQAHQMHQQIKNSTLKIIPDWGHAPYLKHPAPLAHEIVTLLKKADK